MIYLTIDVLVSTTSQLLAKSSVSCKGGTYSSTIPHVVHFGHIGSYVV